MKFQCLLRLSPASGKQLKKTEHDLNVWKRFFHNITGQNREIEHIPGDEPNILSYRFMMKIKKKDGGAYTVIHINSLKAHYYIIRIATLNLFTFLSSYNEERKVGPFGFFTKCCLHSKDKRIKILFNGLGRSVLEESVLSVLITVRGLRPRVQELGYSFC